jgi:hypothetical protein
MMAKMEVKIQCCAWSLGSAQGTMGLFFDNIYSDISGKEQTAPGEVKLNNTLFIMELGAIFRVTDWSSDNSQQPPGAFELISTWAGCRALGVEFEDGEGINRYEIDATFHGPIIGGMFRF